MKEANASRAGEKTRILIDSWHNENSCNFWENEEKIIEKFSPSNYLHLYLINKIVTDLPNLVSSYPGNFIFFYEEQKHLQLKKNCILESKNRYNWNLNNSTFTSYT